MRNVEETDDENLPEVETRIADVEAQSAQKFLARLKRETCFLLHLSEVWMQRLESIFSR